MVSENDLLSLLQSDCKVESIRKLFKDDGRPKNDHIDILVKVLVDVQATVHRLSKNNQRTVEDKGPSSSTTTSTTESRKPKEPKTKVTDRLCPDFLQRKPCRHGNPENCPKGIEGHPPICREGSCYPHRKKDCTGWHVHLAWDDHLAAQRQRRAELKAKRAKHMESRKKKKDDENKKGFSGNGQSRPKALTSKSKGKSKETARRKSFYPPGHPQWARQRQVAQSREPVSQVLPIPPPAQVCTTPRYTAREFLAALQRGGLQIN